jgi:putative methionine-R-sulfoxide reductase with GAF domain
MDPHSILDKDRGDAPSPAEVQSGETPAAELPSHRWPGTAAAPETPQPGMRFPAEDGGRSLAEMAQRDLSATLQLLAERAQYITGATGAAIALRDHEEMMCRASAGTSAPEVGAQLQVNSGLSGESVRTRQTLRCDDATTDGRVNRESCEALGIRSVVVMPLLRGDDVIGVFELFSDKANAFEARDLTALERMGVMVHTALEHSAADLGIAPAPSLVTQPVATSADGEFDEEDEPGFARDAGRALASTMEIGGAATDAIRIPDLETPKPAATMGRFEALAAAQASSRIAFHKKVASPATSGSADTPPVAAEEPSPEPVETAPPAEKTSAVDEKQVNPIESAPAASDEVLERTPQVEAAPAPVDEAPTEEILAVESHAGVEASTPSPAPPPVPAKEDAVAKVAVPEVAAPVAAVARGAIANLKKCAACGFPVSEGRQLCLDCEKKKVQVPAAAAKPTPRDEVSNNQALEVSKASAPQEQTAEMPRFLSGDEEEASWLAKHKLMVLAMALAVVVIVVLMMLR